MLRLTFLGTGTSQGVPMIGCPCNVCRSDDEHDKRLRSSVMIERFSGNPAEYYNGATPQIPACGMYGRSVGADGRIVIDAGPDFRTQMLRENVKTLDAILLTHEHKDHMAGIDDIRAFNYFEKRSIPIYATPRVAETIKKDYDYAFSEYRYPGAPEIDLEAVIPDTDFEVAGFHITPVSGLHNRLPVTGYRIGPLAYLTDFNFIDDSELSKLEDLEVLVINALRHEPHLSHFTVSEAIEIARKVGAKKTYFTHMSHQIGLYNEVNKTLPQGIELAWDGLKVNI